MKERAGSVVRHPRIAAGLWFGTFIGFGQLVCFALQQTTLRLVWKGYPLQPISVFAQPGCFLAAAGAGSWLGFRILEQDLPFAEAVRRGAWVGITAGIAHTLLADLPGRTMSGLNPLLASGALPSAALVAPYALLQGARLLPLGVVAAWCLLRLSRRNHEPPSQRRTA